MAALALLGFVAAACSNGASGDAASSTTTSLLPPPIRSLSVTIHGRVYRVPSEDGVHAINPAVDTGGQIVITDKGFLPYRLFANLNQKVTWTNLSSHPVTITFLHRTNRPRRLPIGGTMTFSSPTETNFVYVSSSGYRGLVAIGDFP